MSYQVLARKFRPKLFEDVIGQEHITQTLMNAIKAGRIAHAYIFSGPRGVGKTTTARLLACALNCETGPTDSPCGTCNSCREIAEGNSLEVIEVDGASNNGVDQVRNLTDTIKYNTSSNKFKVYIIDEVHMLSNAAFNALLKNLEEPPPRVVFIFATTELHKVLETILSRCQQFIFKLIPEKTIITRLKKLVEAEKCEAEEKVFKIIANASGGSMRDAETILEKVITFCGNSITEEKSLLALGLVSSDFLFEMAEGILIENVAKIFVVISKIVNEGRNLDRFVKDSIEFFRKLLFLNVSPSIINVLAFEDNTGKRMNELSIKFKEYQLLYIMDLLCELASNLKFSYSPRTLIEVAFVKICHSRNVLPLDQIVKKLDLVQDRLLSLLKQTPKDSSDNEKISQIEFNFEYIKNKWADFLKHLELKKLMLKNYLNDGILERLEKDSIILSYPESSVFSAKLLNEADYRKELDIELSSFFNTHLSYQIEVKSTEEIDSTNKSETSDEQKITDFGNLSSNQNEFVSNALELFDGKIINIKNADKKGV
ncbi:MAG: hypothetical protein ACD_79C00466G0002 [uncultured bacterium]|nr:MAG: hypothetical protein ACD_79C00466G0002 [uncultured bacterium]